MRNSVAHCFRPRHQAQNHTLHYYDIPLNTDSTTPRPVTTPNSRPPRALQIPNHSPVFPSFLEQRHDSPDCRQRSMAPTSNAEPPNASSSIAPQDPENLAQYCTERANAGGGDVANLHTLREEWTAASEDGSGNEVSDHRDSSDGTERSSAGDSSAATPGTRIAQYEALGGAKLFHGGRGQGFIVARTNYDGKTGSAISKFPAGSSSPTSIIRSAN